MRLKLPSVRIVQVNTCSRSVNNMNEVSNEAICNGITYDISMYVNIVFPV
jgi:hypothetical protein